MIRLVSPSGGATLSAPSIASVYLSDAGAATELQFFTGTLAVAERGFAKAVAVVSRVGSASGASSVDYIISGGSASPTTDFSGPESGTLNWADGDAGARWIEYAIVDDGTGEPDEFIELSLNNPLGAALGSRTQLRIDILDGSGFNEAPNSIAGSGQTVASGATVTLDGSQSNDPNGDSLSYAWTQTLGPAVELANADTNSATFVAPLVNSDTLLRFSLQVTDSGGLSDTATASVTVRSATASSGGGGGGGTGPWLLALLALATGRKRLIRRDAS